MQLALLPVILSGLFTVGILYILYKTFFIRYINMKGDGKEKIISYSFLIGLLTFGLGLQTILNELFFVKVNNSTIQSKDMERGIFTLIFYPLVFWTLGFILQKVFKKLPREIEKTSVASANSIPASSIKKTEVTGKSVNKISEEEYWEKSFTEFNSSQRKEGLWAKCFAEANGDENIAKANYLKVRTTQLMNDSNLTQNNLINKSPQSFSNQQNSIEKQSLKIKEDKLYISPLIYALLLFPVAIIGFLIYISAR